MNAGGNAEPGETAEGGSPFFQRTDWVSGAVTSLLVLSVYLFTLAPQVTLRFSGIYATGAAYAGVPHPPGYPLWTLYGWVFTKLLPWSNVAWRLAVASAVAGALACGVVALMVSRTGGLMLEGVGGLKRLPPGQERWLRGICGYVAGAVLGFDGGLWHRAVIVDTWPLSLLCLAVSFCLLTRWFFRPERRGFLYAAFLAYGLTLSNSQLLLAAALGIQFLVMAGDSRLARDLCLLNVLFYPFLWFKMLRGEVPMLDEWELPFSLAGGFSALVWIGSLAGLAWLVAETRAILTQWKALLGLGASLLPGLSLYLLVPVASSMNPPVNWGYARTVGGFFHVLTRGQYERIRPTGSWSRLADQLRMFGEITATEFGLIFVLAALIPFFYLRRMPARERAWMLGLIGAFVSLTLLLILVLNSDLDRDSRETCKAVFSASHLFLAVWAGYGLMLLGGRTTGHDLRQIP
jgi:hypothetical protein